MYDSRTIRYFANAGGLARRCGAVLCWLCLLFALPSALGFPPWSPSYSPIVRLTSTPEHFYTEEELLRIYVEDSRVSSLVPPEWRGSVSDIFSYISDHYPRELSVPVLAIMTNRVMYVDFPESYEFSTNQFILVSIAPSDFVDFNNYHINYISAHSVFTWYASRYGFGGVGLDGLDYSEPSPAFGAFFSNTNLPFYMSDTFNDWGEPSPLVWSRLPVEGLYQSSAWFSGGSLRTCQAYYQFPKLPNMGPQDRGEYPVRLHTAFQMVDEYYLPFYWQSVNGVVVWTADDTVKIRNVLRFHSPTNNPEGINR